MKHKPILIQDIYYTGTLVGHTKFAGAGFNKDHYFKRSN